MNIKEIFDKAENGTLTYDQFQAMAKEGNAKFTDLSEGNYVSKQKYDDDISVRDTRITTLDDTVKTRDTDLASLQKQLADAGTDATKLGELNTNFTTLQKQYDKDTKALQKQLKDQAYEFAVREFANGKKFTSEAAKRDFVHAMKVKNLQMEGDKIIGADDFATLYSADNADAFVVDKPAEGNTTGKDTVTNPTPSFVQPSGNPNPGNGNENPFAGAFNFTGVRANPNSK